MEQVQVLMGIIRQEVLGQPVDVAPFLALSEQEQQELAELSRKHAIAQLLGDALANDPETRNLKVAKELLPDTFAALGQVEQIEYECKEVCQVLEQAQIPYIRLKGSRIRPCYPQPWMRTSGDNDILVHEENVERGAAKLEEELGYRLESRNYHDFSMYSESDTMLELHFSIRENIPEMDAVLDQVWDYSHPVSGRMEYIQSNEFFIFHLIAHMAYHFVTGGCGIRHFVDLLVLRDQCPVQEDVLWELCRRAGIDRFYENVKKITAVWFAGREHTPQTHRMEIFLLTGGLFGTSEQNIAVKQNQDRSRYALIHRRLFATMDHLCSRYPSLERHKWLLPYYQVRRWIEAYKRGRWDMLKEEFHESQNMNSEKLSQVHQLLEDNGFL